MTHSILQLTTLRHPDVTVELQDWALWRDTFIGGDYYRRNYLERFSDKESTKQFNMRKALTPIPTFAKAAVLDVRNSIFQRLADITRIGGSDSYQKASRGENGGVDREGASMNSFLGINVLTELLIMGRVGIFVDAPSVVPTSLSEEARAPYLYVYPVEDILSWTLTAPEEPGQFKAVRLRDHSMSFERDNLGVELPKERVQRTRTIWKNDITKKVHYIIRDDDDNVIELDGAGEDGSVQLDIDIVPFVMPNIGDSLLKDAASYQVALLNMVSADVYYAIKSNSTFLTIQEDLRSSGAHLKVQGTGPEPGNQRSSDADETIGAGTGRKYDLNTDRPGFIAPPTEPLLASMKLRDALKDDIRELINLAVTNKSGSRTESAEAKKLSSQGLEAGLSYIGMVLQQAEQLIAWFWAAYENHNNPNVAKISYPKRYILKSDEERISEADDLLKVMHQIPGLTIKKSLAKLVVDGLLAGKESAETIKKITNEIQAAKYTTSDIEFILASKEAGMVDDKLASEALGFPEGSVEKAKKDHAARVAATLVAQTPPGESIGGPAARGVPDLDPDLKSGAKEKEDSEGDDD